MRGRARLALGLAAVLGLGLGPAAANKLSQERLDSGGWRGYERDGITSTCQDELLNGDEEGVDCGGSCAPCPTCTDGVRNGDETGIDCGVACQLMCRWPRSCLEMLIDQPSLPSGNYSIYPWRDALQEGAPVSPWVPDTIRPIPAEVSVRVYCDMETDGGGYTIYAVDYGIETSNHTAPNSCHDVGMDIVVPRSREHWMSLLNVTGPEFFSLVPGIYKPSSGGDYSTYAMNSANVPNWVAVDHGSWWLADVPMGEPTGDYIQECWLGMSEWNVTTDGLRFNDFAFNGSDTCEYSSTSYVCSTNDKDFPSHRPPGRPGGRDPATKPLPEPNWPLIVTDAESFAAASAALLTRPPPYHITLARDVWVGDYTMVIPTGKTVHFVSHPEACGGDGTPFGGMPGSKNLGTPPVAHVHHTCQYSLYGIGDSQGVVGTQYDPVTREALYRPGTGHTDGSLGGIFEVQPNGTLLVEDVILHSSVQERGGALNINHADVQVVNCEFRANAAASYGGAVYSLISDLYLENSTFDGNEALAGGAIYNDRGQLATENVTFAANVADERNGGSVYSLMGTMHLFNATFFNNTAKSGGAVYNEEGDLTMSHSIFYENVADWNGGAVYNHYGNIHASNCSMTDNLVYHKGGAIHNHYGNVDVDASNFYCNLARWQSYDYGTLPITKFLGRRAVEINDLDRAGNAIYHRYSDSNGAAEGSAELTPTNLALGRPTDASSVYYDYGGASNWTGLVVDGDTTNRGPPHVFITKNEQPSWWGVHLAQPTTNPTVRFYSSNCCDPYYKHWPYSPQAGYPASDSVAALQQGDFGQTFDCCTVDFGRRVDFYIGYEDNWRDATHCGSITSVNDGGAYSTKCVGEGDYLFVTGGSTSDGWLIIAEVEVIGVPNNWTSVHRDVQIEVVDGVEVEQVTYTPAGFDCNNWFGRQPGVQFTSETVSAHDLSSCSHSIGVDNSTTFEVQDFAPGTLVEKGMNDTTTTCKFSAGAIATAQDVVLDAGAMGAPVAAELKVRKHLKLREDNVRARLAQRGVTPGGGVRRRALQEEEGEGEGEDGARGFHDTPVSAGKDEVWGWLKSMRMEKLRPGLASRGVAVLDDLKFLTPQSMKGLGLTKLAEKRFWSGLRDLRLSAYDSIEFTPMRRGGVETVVPKEVHEASGMRSAEAGASVEAYYREHGGDTPDRGPEDEQVGKEDAATKAAAEAEAAAAADGQAYWADIARATIAAAEQRAAEAEAKAADAEARAAEAEAAEQRAQRQWPEPPEPAQGGAGVGVPPPAPPPPGAKDRGSPVHRLLEAVYERRGRAKGGGTAI